MCVLEFSVEEEPLLPGGGQPRDGAPALTLAHRCVGVTEGTDGRDQRLDLLRHLRLETPVTGRTREKPGLVPTEVVKATGCGWVGTAEASF